MEREIGIDKTAPARNPVAASCRPLLTTSRHFSESGILARSNAVKSAVMVHTPGGECHAHCANIQHIRSLLRSRKKRCGDGRRRGFVGRIDARILRGRIKALNGSESKSSHSAKSKAGHTLEASRAHRRRKLRTWPRGDLCPLTATPGSEIARAAVRQVPCS